MTHIVQKFDAKSYYAGLPKKRVASAAMLIRPGAGGPEILIVRLSYKDGWVLPGGSVDAGEAPAAAVIREVFEEVGVWIDDPELRLVKFFAGDMVKGDLVEFHYVVDVPGDLAVNIDGVEVVEYRWVSMAQARPIMRAGWAERLDDIWQAIETNQVLYAEDLKTAA
jgi:8-oxo-dGTP pyrophosphatase MutT (NUDIX family)